MVHDFLQGIFSNPDPNHQNWFLFATFNLFLVFRYNTKDNCFQQAKPQLAANRPKSLLVRYSAHAMSRNVTLPNHISCIIEHLIRDLAEEPLRQAAKQGNILRLGLSISCNFKQLLFSWQKSPHSFLPFYERPGLHHTCRIPIVSILQIHTQIPPI